MDSQLKIADNVKKSNTKSIMLVRSAGFPQLWVDEMTSNFPDVRFMVADDNEASISSQIAGVNALIGCPRPLFTPQLLNKATPALEWVHAPGAGIEEYLIPELVKGPILFTNGKIIQGPEVSDHALALFLTLTRNIHMHLTGKGPRPMSRPIELRKKTAVIYGVGGIGMLTAEKLNAFGMHIIGVDTRYVPMVSFIDKIVPDAELHHVLPRADVVICCCPNTNRSRYIFDENTFLKMKRDAFFINVSRGQLVRTDDLLSVLDEGWLKGVGLDVTDPEPLPETHPLNKNDRVLITPHLAGLSDHNRRRGFELMRQNIERFISGGPLINVVDKTLGY